MNIFDWLLLGHLTGDWLLQNDWMARHKQRRHLNLAILVHCSIYTAALFGAIELATGGAMQIDLQHVLVVALAFSSHWVIDAADLASLWGRWLDQSDFAFVRIMADQTLHISR